MSTETAAFTSLREMVMQYAHRRGWKSQRTLATYCGVDEAGLSRFLDGRQDFGAVTTYALFRAVRIPTEALPLAFELLALAQAEARAPRREAPHPSAVAEVRHAASGPALPTAAPASGAAWSPAPSQLPPPAIPTGPERRSWLSAPRALAGGVRGLPARLRASSAQRRMANAGSDAAALSPSNGVPALEDLQASEAAALFAAERFSGEQIAAFFAERQ